MRSSCRLLTLVWIAWSLLALASAVFASPPVQLVAPRAGATLATGSMAELEGAPVEPFACFSKGGAAEGLGLRARLDPPAAHRDVALLVSEPDPLQLPEALPGNGAAMAPSDGRRAAFPGLGTDPALTSDILLLIQRQNE